MAVENPNPSDEKLARQAQAGCMSSFEELVHRYEARIYRFIASNCRSAGDAQEVTQDVFVAAFRGLGKFDASRSFQTWLFTIARRKCVDHHRVAKLVNDEFAPEQADGNDPAVLLSRREEEQSLWRLARRVLPELQFHALWLRHAEDMSVAEVARVLGRTRTHVKVLLFRARLRLDSELSGERSSRQNQTRENIVRLSRSTTSISAGVQV